MTQESPFGLVQEIRDKLLDISEAVRAGKMTSAKGKALAQIYKTALYAEQLNLQVENIMERVKALDPTVTELSPETKAQLDEIVMLLKVSPEPNDKEAV